MTKKTIGIFGAVLSSIAGVANAQEILQTLQHAGVQELDKEGKFELSVDNLYGVTQVLQKSGLEISVLGASSKYGKINVQIGKSNKISHDGSKVFTPQTVQELNMFGDVVVN